MPAGSILVADDDAAIRTVLNQALSRAGYEVRSTSNAATLWRWVSQGEGDLVITDVVMPDENAFDLLPRIKKLRPELPVDRHERAEHVHDRDPRLRARRLRISAEAVRSQGAHRHRRPRAVGAEGAHAAGGEARRLRLDPARRPLAGDAGNLPRARAADADRPDRDDLGRIRHRQGAGRPRAARLRQAPQRPVRGRSTWRRSRATSSSPSCSATRRARSPAPTRRSSGRFEQAEGGTLFLDEIGDMPMEAQTRLLRVLQQGEYTTVGGRTPIKADVRIIAATNKDLRILIQQGLFREDLFFRLNVVPLRLPPLRERIEDVPDLIRHFFTQVEREGLPAKQLDQAALDRLKRYRWPGNVRELENLARRLAALYPQETITAAVIDAELSQPAMRRRQRGAARRGGPFRRGRAAPRSLFRELRRRAAAAGALSSDSARDRAPVAVRHAGGHPRQPDSRRRSPRGQPQHAAQEDPRSRHPGVPQQRVREGRVTASGSEDGPFVNDRLAT